MAILGPDPVADRVAGGVEMNRRIVVRRATLGALAAGLVPLAAAGAGASPDNSPGLCRSNFGERGPSSGPIVGEAPPGDPMTVSVGWDPGDWPEGQLGRIVTCVSVDGHAVPSLTNTTVGPPNTGSLTLNLTLPEGSPGALVCEQSLLVGDKGAEGRTRPTSPVCFKLRAPEPASAPTDRSGRPVGSGGRTADGSSSASAGAGSPTTPAIRPAPNAAHAPGPIAPAPAPDPRSTPPARAGYEATANPLRGLAGRGTAAIAGELARSGAAIPSATATAPAPVRRAATAPGRAVARPVATAGAPATALPRTGLESHIPLAGAGGFLALGGLAVMFGTPARRRRPG